MKRRMIIEISASLVEKSQDKSMRLLEEIVKGVYDKRRKLKKAVMSCTVDQNQLAVITLNLKKVPERFIERLKLNLLLDGTLPLKQCTSCGCYYSTFCLYTYRENESVISRSYECVGCRRLNNQAKDAVQTVKQKASVRKVKNYALSCS